VPGCEITMMRYLIVNADDFGLTHGVNRGIMQAHTLGIVTSASLMVYGSAASEAADYSRRLRSFSTGLHLDLGEWIYGKGDWQPIYQRAALNNPKAVEKEVSRQLAMFRRLLHKNPTHLDTHQHIHRHAAVLNVLVRLSHRLGIPLRHYNLSIHYCSAFYGQTGEGVPRRHVLSRLGLRKILKGLPIGLSELCCHPGLDNDVKSVYRTERTKEVKVLCDPRIQETLIAEAIALCSYADLEPLRIA
jgi:chitin disaccharide deacetylase